MPPGTQKYPAYPRLKTPCHHPPVPADNTRRRRSVGRGDGPHGVAWAGAWMSTTGRCRFCLSGSCLDAGPSTTRKGAAQGMRPKNRSWEAAFASSISIILGRKPLFTVPVGHRDRVHATLPRGRAALRHAPLSGKPVEKTLTIKNSPAMRRGSETQKTLCQWLSRGMPSVWAIRWYFSAGLRIAPLPSWSTRPRWISCQGVWCLGNL